MTKVEKTREQRGSVFRSVDSNSVVGLVEADSKEVPERKTEEVEGRKVVANLSKWDRKRKRAVSEVVAVAADKDGSVWEVHRGRRKKR